MSGYGPRNTPLKRFDVKNLKDEIMRALNLEKGLLYTIINLAIRPGETLNTYLFEDRRKLIKPLPFLLLTVALATFFTLNFLDLEEAFGTSAMNTEGLDEKAQEFVQMYTEKFTQYYNVLLLISVPFLAFSSYLLYNKHRYNFAEHLVIGTYLTCMMNIAYVLLFPFFRMDYGVTTLVLVLMFTAYSAFALIQVFKERIGIGILKGIALQFLYYMFFTIIGIVFVIIIVVFMVIKTKLG